LVLLLCYQVVDLEFCSAGVVDFGELCSAIL